MVMKTEQKEDGKIQIQDKGEIKFNERQKVWNTDVASP